MISSKDRAGYFGASDTAYVMGNWDTESFKKWWLEKLGLRRSTFTNKAMRTGTHYEHKILDLYDVDKDIQIILEPLLLRVNYDGLNTNPGRRIRIVEVKTHNHDKPYKLSKAHREQCQVEMFVAQVYDCIVASYGLTKDDYLNYFNEIDPARLEEFEVEYDQVFIDRYGVRLSYLARCLKDGRMPKATEL